MSIEESRKRRAEQQAQAKQQKLTPAAPEQAKPPIGLDLSAAIREAIHEAVAAELEAQTAQQVEPVKAGLQRIYSELAEMRTQLKLLLYAAQAQAQANEHEDEQEPTFSVDVHLERAGGDEGREELEEENAPVPSPARWRAPTPLVLGGYNYRTQRDQEVRR